MHENRRCPQIRSAYGDIADSCQAAIEILRSAIGDGISVTRRDEALSIISDKYP